ncbi:MAG TPA: ACT domain-containing protein [Candidatus Faecaligallichristensenella faecipullorum]|nr:ACT domain-containing protein [Candidatus Faecaligallichristensenella faecipullorum]
MLLEWLKPEFTVCRLKALDQAKVGGGYLFFAKTDHELSLVCESQYAPSDAPYLEAGWNAFRVKGQLEFSLIGILSGITGVLKDAKIGVFVVSTYDTDYVLVKTAQREAAHEALRRAGYAFEAREEELP